MIDSRAEYHRRLDAWKGRIAELDREHFLVSNLRLLLAVGGAASLWYAFVRGAISPAWVLLPAAAFGAVAVYHARRLLLGERARRAQRLYERGLARLDDEWTGSGQDGARFLEGHPFARDLDLFGRGSLFELISTASTESGEATLAGWLSAGADLDEIRARQAAIGELKPMADFREDLSVLAAEAEVSRTGAIAGWAGAGGAGFTTKAGPALAFCAIATIVIAALVFGEQIGARWLVAWLLVQAGIAALWRKPVQRAIARVATPERDLALFSDLLARIERERFTAPRLAALEAALRTGGLPPSRRIAQLRRLVSWLDSSRNQLFAPIAAALLLRSQLAVAIDRWRSRWGPAVCEWIGVVGELEALAALATYAYEHPADPFPELVDHGPLFDAESLRHPLLPGRGGVPNDVRLGSMPGAAADGPRVIIVSGSNMSGKSTLLRTVGVNAVLALAGAPVRASALRISPLAIGATLKIEDSLQAGHSRFYAEILRIRAIAETGRGPVPLLFLLDEILHGTNSHDRRIGAEAIVRALVAEGAIGLVTTHDLALTELAATLGKAAVNMHFEDRLEEGRMVFDYRMRPGVVEHSNALALMRAIGLDV